jgi:hypothetical protein
VSWTSRHSDQPSLGSAVTRTSRNHHDEEHSFRVRPCHTRSLPGCTSGKGRSGVGRVGGRLSAAEGPNLKLDTAVGVGLGLPGSESRCGPAVEGGGCPSEPALGLGLGRWLQVQVVPSPTRTVASGSSCSKPDSDADSETPGRAGAPGPHPAARRTARAGGPGRGGPDGGPQPGLSPRPGGRKSESRSVTARRLGGDCPLSRDSITGDPPVGPGRAAVTTVPVTAARPFKFSPSSDLGHPSESLSYDSERHSACSHVSVRFSQAGEVTVP